jgi:hypothetical protein
LIAWLKHNARITFLVYFGVYHDVILILFNTVLDRFHNG